MTTDEQLRARIAELEREMQIATGKSAALERQLERYAAEFNDTYKQLSDSYRRTVRGLAEAVEARDAYTAHHAERVAAYGVKIAAAVGMSLGDKLEFGFLLHDVGKVAVPDAILHKPGPLTPDEWAIIQRHPLTGLRIVPDIEFLAAARDVIRSHHERWDGKGYPDGLAGTEIPLAARVFAVADALDALTSDRPYRRASSLAQARLIIIEDSGTHFDPQVVAAFKSLPDSEFEHIRQEIR